MAGKKSKGNPLARMSKYMKQQSVSDISIRQGFEIELPTSKKLAELIKLYFEENTGNQFVIEDAIKYLRVQKKCSLMSPHEGSFEFSENPVLTWNYDKENDTQWGISEHQKRFALAKSISYLSILTWLKSRRDENGKVRDYQNLKNIINETETELLGKYPIALAHHLLVGEEDVSRNESNVKDIVENCKVPFESAIYASRGVVTDIGYLLLYPPFDDDDITNPNLGDFELAEWALPKGYSFSDEDTPQSIGLNGFIDEIVEDSEYLNQIRTRTEFCRHKLKIQQIRLGNIYSILNDKCMLFGRFERDEAYNRTSRNSILVRLDFEEN